MPLTRTMLTPGPSAMESIRPSTTPRGVGNFWLDSMIARCPSDSYFSISGTVAVLWT